VNNVQLVGHLATSREHRKNRVGRTSTASGPPLSRSNRDSGTLVGGRAEARDAAPQAARHLVVYLGELEVLLSQPVERQGWHS
jgi:hypothetical protein